MNFSDICGGAVRLSLIALSVFSVWKRKPKSVVITAAVTFALTFLPPALNALFGINIDVTGTLLYYVIVFSSVFLGIGCKFYDKFAWWDIMIHSMAGIAFVSLGLALTKKTEGLNKFGILFFCLTLSGFLHLIWEIFEFFSDCILHSNNQRWQKRHDSINHKPESAIQPAGLVDTMSDSVACVSGAVLACAVWWFIL